MPVASLVEKLVLSDLSNTPYPFPFVAFNLSLTAHTNSVNSVNRGNGFAPTFCPYSHPQIAPGWMFAPAQRCNNFIYSIHGPRANGKQLRQRFAYSHAAIALQ
jgi:hypothetical protein